MKHIAFCLALTAFSLLCTTATNSQQDAPRPPVIIATFSIAAVDPETGQCGAAVASKYPAVGKVCAHARAGVGAFCTQHYAVQAWGTKALDLLADKKLPEEVFTELLKTDKFPGGRQLGIIDMQGR